MTVRKLTILRHEHGTTPEGHIRYHYTCVEMPGRTQFVRSWAAVTRLYDFPRYPIPDKFPTVHFNVKKLG